MRVLEPVPLVVDAGVDEPVGSGEVDDHAARRDVERCCLVVREAEERDVGAGRERRVVRDEPRHAAPAVAAEARIERPGRLARERVRPERVQLERRMREHAVERLLTGIPGRPTMATLGMDVLCISRRVSCDPLRLGERWRGCYIARAVERVLVLNASYEPLNVCSVRRAHVLVWKGKAEVLESHGQPLRTSTSNFTRPHVIRLVTYVRVPRGVTKRISRRVLFARDGWKCVYCGTEGNRLTLDHVIPRSRGGTSVWENVVTSCAPCNHRKGDRLLEETSMTLHSPPRPPTPVLFIRLATEHVPDVWRRYLPGLEKAAAAA